MNMPQIIFHGDVGGRDGVLKKMQMIYAIVVGTLLVFLVFGAGALLGYKLPKDETKKLEKIAFEIENIEKSAEARLRIQIHQITARIKSLL